MMYGNFAHAHHFDAIYLVKRKYCIPSQTLRQGGENAIVQVFFLQIPSGNALHSWGGMGGGNEQLALHEKYIDEKCYNSNSRVFFFKIEMNFYIYILLSFFSELPIVKIVYQNPCALFAFQREWPPLQLGKRLKAKS